MNVGRNMGYLGNLPIEVSKVTSVWGNIVSEMEGVSFVVIQYILLLVLRVGVKSCFYFVLACNTRSCGCVCLHMQS
jgi:hypothetical protein